MQKFAAGKFAVALTWFALLLANWLAPACAVPASTLPAAAPQACCAVHPASCCCPGIRQKEISCGGSCVCAPKSAPGAAPVALYLSAELPAALPCAPEISASDSEIRASRFVFALRRDSCRARPVANAPPRAPPFPS